GVARAGVDRRTWADEVDVRPTLLALTGLSDGYAHDGRVISDVLDAAARPAGIRSDRSAYERLAAALKQLDAPAGRLGMGSVVPATRAIASDGAGDAIYRAYLIRAADTANRRDAVAGRMREALWAAAFDVRPVDPRAADHLVASAARLTERATAV